MTGRAARRLLTAPLCLGVLLIFLGVYPSLTPHVAAVGFLGAISSALSMRWIKLKFLTIVSAVLYIAVFTTLALIPGSLLVSTLAYLASAFSALTVLGLIAMSGG